MVCVLALATPGAGPGGSPRIEIFHGEMNGELARQARGEGGFGYDPVFLQADGRTNAELPADEKDAVSHRGRAVAAAMPRLRELLQAPA
jgi:XTP/dITP diphosphohydrolase